MLIEPQSVNPYSTHFITKHFLIVPIFFRKSIEAVLETNYPQNGWGFIYGVERENYRIIKKIWPVKCNHLQRPMLSQQDLNMASQVGSEHNLQLLGCFHTGPVNLFLDRHEISKLSKASFSNIRVSMTKGKTTTWHSSLIGSGSTVTPETVLL